VKNITITLSEETAKWVRVWAAEQEKSVSAALAELVEEKRRDKLNRQEALARFFGGGLQVISDGSCYPARKVLHER
jgi:hypothetical protein